MSSPTLSIALAALLSRSIHEKGDVWKDRLVEQKMSEKKFVEHMQERDQAVQKKAYKLLAHMCEQRQDFLANSFGDVLEALVTGMPTALSAAKRHRLRCLQVSVLLLLRDEVPGIAGREELSTPAKRQQV